MPATGPGRRQCQGDRAEHRPSPGHGPTARPGQAAGQGGRERGGDGRPEEARLERVPDLGRRRTARCPRSPESDQTGGRPSVARPPTRPARQTRLYSGRAIMLPIKRASSTPQEFASGPVARSGRRLNDETSRAGSSRDSARPTRTISDPEHDKGGKRDDRRVGQARVPGCTGRRPPRRRCGPGAGR